jgi:mannan endo-1,4-beta-mannosidase
MSPRPPIRAMRTEVLVAVGCAALVAATVGEVAAAPRSQPTTRAAKPPRPGFVRVQGKGFVLDGKPFFFVGANLNVMHGPRARARAAQTIAAAAKDGLRVGRVWALGEGRADASSWDRAHTLFRAGPRGWLEAAFVQLDRVLVAARRHKLKLIVTLSNRWKDYGGIPMYLRWLGQRDRRAYGYHDRFFTLPAARRLFVAHLRRVVSRVNSISGVAYKDDPTIFAWELQNELNGVPEAAAARRRWVSTMAAEVRRLDPNHMVVPGVLGYFLRHQRRPWIQMCQLPGVSYCDQHIYPEEHALTRSPAGLRRFVDDRVQLAHYVVGKPIVFGEFGFADRGSAARRARRHGRLLSQLFRDGGNGALVWIYQPRLHWRRRYGVLVDQRRHRPLRRLLARRARLLLGRAPRLRNRRLGPQVGDALLAPTHVRERRSRRLHRRWRALGVQRGLAPPRGAVPRPRVSAAVARRRGRCRRLALPVDRYAESYFEEAGSWDGGVLVHAYGRRSGYLEYRFAGAPFAPRTATIHVRLSSEYPGSTAPPHGSSLVEVSLDGQPIARVVAPPDDGRGRWFALPVRVAKLLRRLRGGVHRLRFRVPDGPDARGVAIYGREAPDNREPVRRPGALALVACR